MKPREIKKSLQGLDVSWTDGSLQSFPFGELRKSCRCAVCRESKVPLTDALPYYGRATAFQKLELVGNYAMAVTWGDGHRSIFAFESLV